jgi:hypothetical protein
MFCGTVRVLILVRWAVAFFSLSFHPFFREFPMSKFLSLAIFGLCLCFLSAAAPMPSWGASDVQSDIKRLEKRLGEQEKLVEQQQRLLEAQAKEIGKQKVLIDSLTEASSKTAAETRTLDEAKASPTAPKKKTAFMSSSKKRGAARHEAHARPTERASSLVQPRVVASEEVERPQVDALANQGGVLSPPGVLTFENTIEYTNTTRNLFAFNGVELAQVVLVGGITASSARHQIVQETARLRLGLTDRLEVDVHAPFVYRNDALTNTVTSSSTTTSVEGTNLGDIDAGLAYQLNQGRQGWPFLIGNLRYKANNADGPFDVPYNSSNIARKLPTGTGFQTVEASMTAIKVSDPAVLFGNLGYVYDMPRDINKDFNGVYVGHVKPGDAINALAGFGFAVNPDISFSLGYKHSFVLSTTQKTTQSGVTSKTRSGTSQVGALTFGLSYAVSPETSVNFNVETGVTNDAPDVHLIFRVPIHLGELF